MNGMYNGQQASRYAYDAALNIYRMFDEKGTNVEPPTQKLIKGTDKKKKKKKKKTKKRKENSNRQATDRLRPLNALNETKTI